MDEPLASPVGAAPIESRSEAETHQIGRSIGQRLEAGAIILLSGELGAGKTALVRGIADGLGIESREVSSPTFTLIQEYRGGRLRLYHVDLYRLQPAEVDDLGLDELVVEGGVVAIEWPDRLPRPFNTSVQIELRHIDASTRTIDVRWPPK